MIGAVIFDLDGTLVETEELKALSYARAAVELRPELREEDVLESFRDLVGLSRQEVAVALMQRFGLEEAARARLGEFGVGEPWEAYVQIRLRHYGVLLAGPDTILDHRYPHNVALLDEVQQMGYPTGLSTMSYREQAVRVLGILGLSGAFDAIVARDDVEAGKPDPEMDLLVAQKLGVPPEECLILEDSPAGVRAGLGAGMEVVAVTTDLTRRQFREIDLLDRGRVVDDPRELSGVVRGVIADHDQASEEKRA